MKRAFTIIRVSEEDQLRGYGPDVQASEVEIYMKDAGLMEISRRIVQEESTTWDRPQFEAILDEVINLKRMGELDVVVFPRTDRLARKWDAFGYYIGKLRREGLEVHFAREKEVALDDPMQAAMLFLYGIKAHADADTIRVNTTRGRRMRAERDHRMPTGGYKWAFIYDRTSGRYSVNHQRATWVRKWRDWTLEEGASLNECCRRMTRIDGRKWYPSTMVRILTDPAIIGKFFAYRHRVVRNSDGKKRINVPEQEWLPVYEDPTQAILNEQDFHALRERFRQNQENAPRSAKYWYPPLRGMVVCQDCSRVMTGLTTNAGTTYYRCPVCRCHENAERLWQEIKTKLMEMLLIPERLIPAIKAQFDSGTLIMKLEKEIREKQAEIKNWDQAKDKAVRMHLLFPDYPLEKLRLRFDEIGVNRERALKELAKLEGQLKDARQIILSHEGVRRFCQLAARNLDTMSDQKWRVLLEAMRLRIAVGHEAATVKIAVPVITDEKDGIVLQPSRR